MSRLLTGLCALFCIAGLTAQTPQDAVVPLQLSAGLNPPAVFLSWQNPEASDIVLRRRLKGAAGDSWVELVNANNTLLNGYFDSGLDGNETYEYAVERKTATLTANGFAFANFFKPVEDQRGKILVFIDSTTADQLGADLITFKNDLRGEGWQTVPMKTGPFTTVQWIKNQIVSAYNADPSNVKAILLIGNVPIPYSGSTAWDGKSDHVGAWPCDAFYGDVNGVWTDQSVNLPNTSRLANRNVPGDGKFDQNTLPSAVEIPVGRLDFRRLSAATFGATPVELLRKYLFKNHLWRTGQYKTPKLALVDDHLGWSNGEAFASDGYRNANPLVGEGNVITGQFLNSQRYLLAFGAGSNGTYSSADGIGTALNFATDSVRSVFTNLYGDYFGDWDFETNPLLPALLASKGGVLAVSWAGRPHWMQHGLASGETMGYCLKETQNAQYNLAYGHSNGESSAAISLLGDPTLRAKVVAPATNLSVVSNCDRVNLHWTASEDPEVLAYLVYRSFSLDGPYERVTPDLVFQTSWSDLAPVADTLFYSVRAVKLEVTPGGGAFYNSSTGAPKSVVFVPGTGPTAIGLGGFLNCNITSLTLGTNFSPANSNVQWYKPNGDILNGFTATEGGVYTVVVTAPNGCTTAAYATVYLDTLLPQPMVPGYSPINCTNPNVSYLIPEAPANVHYYFNGVEVLPGQLITYNEGWVLTVSSTANGCSKDYYFGVVQDFSPPGAFITDNGLVLNCSHPTIQLFGHTNALSAMYAWSNMIGWTSTEQNPTILEAGTYCLTVTGLNGCSSTSCVDVQQQQQGLEHFFSFDGDPCTPGPKTLTINVIGGMTPYTYQWSTGGSDQSVVLPMGFSGPVSVQVTDQNGCMLISTIYISADLEVLALTKKETAPGAMDGSIDLLVLNGPAPFQFLWSNGSTSEDISGLASGTYTVTVTDLNGCSLVLVVPLITLETETPNALWSLDIAPNPASNSLGVYFKSRPSGALLLQLMDMSGKVLATQIGAENVFHFEIAHLPTGVYQLWVGMEPYRKAYRVVVGR